MKKIDLTTTATHEFDQKRLDVVLSRTFTDYSRAQIQTWIENGHVTVNQKTIQKTRHPVRAGDVICIQATLTEQCAAKPEAIALNIVYEDADLIVINKPVGLIVHPGAGNPEHTLVNALLHHDPQLQQLPRAGIVHRLDKDTSGLLVAAKTLEAHHALTQAMQARKIQREYRAVVEGVMISGGTIDAPIGRHKTARTKMAVNLHGGKDSVTHYRVLERFAHHTLLSVQLETGRTHQIRVHFAHLRYPIVGDPTYNARKSCLTFPRQALHAYQLSLTHPRTHEVMTWTAELPEDMERLLVVLRAENIKNKSA